MIPYDTVSGLPALLIMLLVLGLVFGTPFAAGWGVGRWFGRRHDQRAALDDEDRAELARLRELVGQIRHDAYEHMRLDSSFAVIVADTIRTSESRANRSLPTGQ
ncbi:MAG TPA: hypothetical protein VFR87_16525 [Nocardioidaceae bacterium]|nr:hypothetical protein [Nocardioidaceae bacterium]